MEAVLLLFPVVIGLIVLIRVLAGVFDHNRIRQYVESRGGREVEIHWSPFGPGWFGEKDARIYSVYYRDEEGNDHKAYCKTSLFGGVYFTEDRVVSYADHPPAEAESLEEENRRLREELERLRRDR